MSRMKELLCDVADAIGEDVDTPAVAEAATRIIKETSEEMDRRWSAGEGILRAKIAELRTRRPH